MQALSRFIDRTLELTGQGHLSSPFDPGWRSPCELHQDRKFTYWRPVPQSPPVRFDGLANALETGIHPDIVGYYSGYWSGTLEADSEEGRVSLIQLWNTDDFDRLIANLIGHALAKKRARLPFTVFFATTDADTEFFLSIDNETGKVWLEEPGSPPLREIDTGISAFLRRLTPRLRQPDIY